MAKEPVAGKVKTRLCPPLTHHQAAEFYRCFLLDVFATARELQATKELKPLDVFVAYHPPEAENTFRSFIPPGFQLFPQEGTDLSERLINGFSRLFSQGYTTVAVLGGDSPTLPPQDLVAGFLALENKKENFSLAIKPSLDGGYCFLVMKQFYPEVFRDIDWSTEYVGKQTIERAKASGIKWLSLPPGYDIDTAKDFNFLHELLARQKAGESLTAGRRTLEFFRTHLIHLI